MTRREQNPFGAPAPTAQPTGDELGASGLGPPSQFKFPAAASTQGFWSWAVMLICLIVTAATYLVVHDHETRADANRFEASVRETRLALAERLTYYTAALRGAQGLFATTDRVTPAQWKSYVDGLDIATHYPGIKCLSFIELINGPHEHDSLLKRMASFGIPDFKIHPENDSDQYRVVTMAEPAEVNRQTIGLDRCIDRQFRLAMDRAAERGSPAVTPKVAVPAHAPGAAVVMFLPVYRPGMPHASPEDRRDATVGWVSSTIRVPDLIAGIATQRLEHIAITVYDEHADINHLLHVVSRVPEPGRLSSRIELPIGGRVWWLGFESSSKFEAGFWRSPSSLVLPVGLAIGCLLSVVVWSLTTTRNRAERLATGMISALNKSEHQLRLFIEHAPAAVAMFDKDLRYLMTSRRWITDYQLQNRQIIGKTHYEVFPEVPSHWRAIHRRCLAGAVERNNAEKFVRSDGKVQWLRWEVRPWLSSDAPDAPIGGIVMLTHDITSEKLAQEEASRASSLARWVLSATSEVAIIGTDPNGVITVFNVGAEKMLGYSAEEVVGKMTPAIIHDPEEVKRRAAEVTRELGKPVDGFNVFVELARHHGAEEREWTYIRKDGSRITVNLMVTSSLEQQGTIFGYLFVGVDITKRKRAESELVAAKVAAEASNRAKSAFLANMSHEIRTPMNGIIGMADLLLASQLNDQQHEYAGTIKSSSQSLLTILNDILDYSKIEAGKLTIEWIDFDLHDTLISAVELFRESAQSKGLSLSYKIAPDVPRLVRCDPSRLRQVVMNLVGNAVKFTLKGGIEVSASWIPESSKGSEMLRVEVADTGIGIEPEMLRNLFTPFTQADESTTRRFGGSGLGLAICQELVDRMRGTIGVHSTPGHGSVFWFTITPEAVGEFASLLDEIPHGVRVRHESLLPPRSLEPTGPKKHVLIVEDHRVNQRVLQLLLEQLGYDVTVAANGREGIEQFEARPFDAILMDCQMPEVDGYEATGRIRELEEKSGRTPGHVPIIAMTAHAMEGDRQACLDAGMDDYLSKPVQVEALAAVLEQWTTPGAFEARASYNEDENQLDDNEHSGPLFTQTAPLPSKPNDDLDQSRPVSESQSPPSVPAAETKPPPALFNAARFRLVTGGRAAMVEQLVPMFIEETQVRIDAMRERTQAGDHAEVARIGHTAYGSCAMIGVESMAALFKEVELKAKAQELDSAQPQIEALARLMPEVAQKLREFKL